MNIKSHLFYITVIGIVIFFLIKSCKGTPAVNPPSHNEDKKEVEALKKQVVKDAEQAYKVISGLEQENKALITKDSLRIIERNQLKYQIALFKIKKYDTTLMIGDCQELVNDFSDYVELTDAESKKCDSIISDKDGIISNHKKIDSIRRLSAINLNKAFVTVVDKYDSLYDDYKKLSPRTILFFGINGQYNNSSMSMAVGGELMVKFKNDFAISGGALVDVKNGVIWTGGFKYPIRLRKH